MVIRFDKLNRFEPPKIYLCNPGSKNVGGVISGAFGILMDTSDEELVLNFNAISEFNFRVNRIRRDNKVDNSFAYNLYKSVQNRRMIYLDDVGFFVITHVDTGFDGGNYYKDVHAESCEVEIQNKMVPFIANGTYQFTKLLETVIATVPGWTIGEVDSNVAALYRTFEDVSDELNCLGFMLENMQDAYECIFTFNCVNRTINAFAQDNYIRQTNIHLTNDDLINSVEITEGADDLYTAISVFGGDELNIVAVNPLGTNVIYNFDYYIPWMSVELRELVEDWKSAVSGVSESYYLYNAQYYTKLGEQQNVQQEINRLDTQLTMYRRCRENVIANANTLGVDEYNAIIQNNEGAPIVVSEDIKTTTDSIDSLISSAQSQYTRANTSLQSINDSLALLEQSISDIRQSVAIPDYFEKNGSSSLVDELMNYIYEGSYTDEYIIVTDNMSYKEKFDQMKVLYDRAVKKLERISQPTQEFDIDVQNFLFVKEFEPFSDQLETGCLINVELDENDVAMLFLSNITVNYDDETLSLTFGNRFNRFDNKSLFDGALGDIKKTANTISYMKEILYPIKNGELNIMKEYLENSRTLSKNMVLSASDEEVLIDDSGYTGRKMLDNGSFDDRQVKITHNQLVFTNDGWDSSDIAIGEIIIPDDENPDSYTTAYGINSKYLIGDIIIGNSLNILSNDGTPLLIAIDDKIESTVSSGISGLQTNINQNSERIEFLVDGIESFTREVKDRNGNVIGYEVDHVTTETGYTFGKDGLRVARSGDAIENLITNKGMYVNRDNDNLLTVDSTGVNAINVTTRQYLTIGTHARFEPYSTNRTGCFYI